MSVYDKLMSLLRSSMDSDAWIPGVCTPGYCILPLSRFQNAQRQNLRVGAIELSLPVSLITKYTGRSKTSALNSEFDRQNV